MNIIRIIIEWNDYCQYLIFVSMLLNDLRIFKRYFIEKLNWFENLIKGFIYIYVNISKSI